MKRKRVQPKRRTVRTRKPAPRKSKPKKPPVSFSEMLLNWVIVILGALVVIFLLSFVWRVISPGKPEIPKEKDSVVEPISVPVQPIRLEVLNGCGVAGIANRCTEFLRDQGFDVVNTDNYRNFNVDSSFVLDRRSIKTEYAQKVADVLGIGPTLVKPLLNSDLNLEATVVIGKDYKRLSFFQE